MTDPLALAIAQQPPDNGMRIGVVLVSTSATVTVDVGGGNPVIGLLNGVRPPVGATVALIRQASTWLLMGTVEDPATSLTDLFPTCKIYQNTLQGFTSGATATFDFDTLEFDTTGGLMWDAVTPNQIMCPIDGIYLPGGGGSWVSNATGGRGVLPQVNGANVNGGWARGQAASGVSTMVPVRSQPERMLAGDVLTLIGLQGSGTSPLNSAVGTTAERPTLSLTYLRPR